MTMTCAVTPWWETIQTPPEISDASGADRRRPDVPVPGRLRHGLKAALRETQPTTARSLTHRQFVTCSRTSQSGSAARETTPLPPALPARPGDGRWKIPRPHRSLPSRGPPAGTPARPTSGGRLSSRPSASADSIPRGPEQPAGRGAGMRQHDRRARGLRFDGPAITLYERFLWRLFGGDHALFERYKPYYADKSKIAEALRQSTGPS